MAAIAANSFLLEFHVLIIRTEIRPKAGTELTEFVELAGVKLYCWPPIISEPYCNTEVALALLTQQPRV